MENKNLIIKEFEHSSFLKNMLAGNSVFTLQNILTRNRFTFKVQKKKNERFWFVSVLTGQNNINHFSYIGYIHVLKNTFDKFIYKHSSKKGIKEDAISVKVFNWYINILQHDKTIPPEVKVFNEGKCFRCGRRLTVPETIKEGIGIECKKIIKQEQVNNLIKKL